MGTEENTHFSPLFNARSTLSTSSHFITAICTHFVPRGRHEKNEHISPLFNARSTLSTSSHFTAASARILFRAAGYVKVRHFNLKYIGCAAVFSAERRINMKFLKSALTFVLYLIMFILVCIFFTGNGTFIYEGF